MKLNSRQSRATETVGMRESTPMAMGGLRDGNDRHLNLALVPSFAAACLWAVALLISNSACDGQEPTEYSAVGESGVVASVQPLATQAGIAAFQREGNAVDAAVATALTLGVVDNHNSGIGGGCFILIRTADGRLIAIDGREAAPKSATREMFLVDGKADTQLSQLGALASGVPGALAAYDLALRLSGKGTLADALLPASRLAEEGFEIDAVYARALANASGRLKQFPESARVLLKPDGTTWAAGEVLRQQDLAETYRQVAEHGLDWFYRGPFAEKTAAWMSKHGGQLTVEDFAAYRAKIRQPIVSDYRGYQIVGFPPPSSGGVHVAQILNILESFDLASLHRQDPAQFTHVVAEAMKLAFADRAHWLGDADYVRVPKGLISKEYARELAEKIKMDGVLQVRSHGQPPAADGVFSDRHTTHIAAADAEGNWVAITATVNTTFGSKVIIPGTGVVMNNEMDDFAVAPGVPNAFGLLGAEANAVAPEKRPLSSMSPTIVLKNGEPVMSVGAAGGPKIITQSLLAIVRYIDLQQGIAEALRSPRFHHQWSPDQLLVEASTDEVILDRLRELGHQIQTSRVVGISQAIARESISGAGLRASHDPRVPGLAQGWNEGKKPRD
jgi:gamma-glutamyltranspeptidase/glutathione hydrolase